MKINWWVDSGLASQAAHELAWFVILVFVGLGVMIWRDIQKEKKEKKDD